MYGCVQDFHVTRANKKLVREQCYGPQDLHLGAFIHVYGRDFFLHDADDFTKHWYSVRALISHSCHVCFLHSLYSSPPPLLPLPCPGWWLTLCGVLSLTGECGSRLDGAHSCG